MIEDKYKINLINLCALLIFSLSPQLAMAADISSMFANFSAHAPAIMRMILVFSKVAGYTLIFISIMQLLKSQVHNRAEIKQPIITMIVGATLSAVSALFVVVSNTLLESPSSFLSYSGAGGGVSASFAAAVTGVLWFVRILGLIAIVRGILKLKGIGDGQGGGQGGGLNSALIHIVGGVMAVNINATIAMFAATFGVDTGGLI